jgi:hypothetical protein
MKHKKLKTQKDETISKFVKTIKNSSFFIRLTLV